jgi:uncharacterized protein YcgI (DUF1989 family)
VGDGLYDNERRKLLEIVEDTTEGVHDTLIAACDDARYKELGGGEGHRNCADNLVEGLGTLGWFSFLFSFLYFTYCCLFDISGDRFSFDGALERRDKRERW